MYPVPLRCPHETCCSLPHRFHAEMAVDAIQGERYRSSWTVGGALVSCWRGNKLLKRKIQNSQVMRHDSAK